MRYRGASLARRLRACLRLVAPPALALVLAAGVATADEVPAPADAAAPGDSSVRSRLRDLLGPLADEIQLSGYLESRVGMWLHDDPTAPIHFPGITGTPPGNDLAVFRNTFQLELDAEPTRRTDLHAVFRAVYEPRYPVDRYASPQSSFGEDRLSKSFYNEPDWNKEPIREAWIQQEILDGQSIRIGRQIVNWGESLAFRVADVINPNDTTFNLFFVDPEESRIPQWMAQGIHQLPWLPGSPAFEWIVMPAWETQSRRVNDLAPTGSRFAIPPESRQSTYPVFQTVPGKPALWTVQRAVLNGRAAGTPAAVDFRFLDDGQKDFPQDPSVGGRMKVSVGPVELAFFDWYGYELLPVVRDRGLEQSTVGEYDTVLGRPDLANVYHALHVPPSFRLDSFEYLYPRQNVVGVTGNAYLEWIKGVTRFEVAYRPQRHFQIDGFDRATGAITDHDGLVRRDELEWQLALDLGGLYWHWLNPTSDFSFSLEYTQNVIFDHVKGMRAGVYETALDAVTDTLSLRGSTSYWYNSLQPSLTVIVQPKQGAWATVAALGLQAPWDEDLTAEIRWVAVGGRSHFDGLGLFQSKDFAMLALRYSF
jgi:hypothetical protein